MTYIDYHNAHADTYAVHMFDCEYAHLSPIAQQLVDDRLAGDYLDERLAEYSIRDRRLGSL